MPAFLPIETQMSLFSTFRAFVLRAALGAASCKLHDHFLKLESERGRNLRL
jgi:hypothetical protein